MEPYEHKRDSRSITHVLGFILAIIFVISSFTISIVISEFSVFTKIIGYAFMVIFFVLGAGGIFETVYRFIKPVYWIIGISGSKIYWESPKYPKDKKQFELGDIDTISIGFGDVNYHFLLLKNGVKYEIPSGCLYKADNLLKKLLSVSPEIKLRYQGKPYRHNE